MANWLSDGFVTQKRQSLLDLSVTDDIFITIRDMARHDETISKLMVESLRAESDSLRKESREHLAKAKAKTHDYDDDFERAIACSERGKKKKEEVFMLNTKLLAIVESRKNASLISTQAEHNDDFHAVMEWYPLVQAADRVLAVYDAEEILEKQKRIQAKRTKRSPPARSSNDATNKDTTGVDEAEEADDDSMEEHEGTDLDVPAAAKHKEGRKRKGKSGRSAKLVVTLALRSDHRIGM
jgi:hypothetical protein